MIAKKIQKDLADKILLSSKDRMLNFKSIPKNNQGFVLLNLPRRLQQDIMSQLDNIEMAGLINYLDPDEATDLLQRINIKRRMTLLEKLRGEIKEKVEFLLKFNPKTAAGMMSLDYIEVEKKFSFEVLSKIIQRHEKRTGRVPTVLAVEAGFLIGEIPLHSLALARKDEKIEDYIKKLPYIKYNRNEKAVIMIFKRHPHNKIVVLNEDNSILGIIYSDDVLQIIERQTATNLSNFAGVNEEEDALDSAFTKVKNRYKWLITNLATAFLAASVVSLFRDTISAFVLLAVYMPIVAGMGGNAGTQTLAVTVRGLALKEISAKTGKIVIINEIIAGLIDGAIVGVLVAIISFLWNRNLTLGLIIGLAMIINLIISGLFGATIPLIMKKLGKDPATSATIFITTATDVLGFLTFLGLASIML